MVKGDLRLSLSLSLSLSVFGSHREQVYQRSDCQIPSLSPLLFPYSIFPPTSTPPLSSCVSGALSSARPYDRDKNLALEYDTHFLKP